MIATTDPLYHNVARVLRIGFRIAASLIVVGLVIALVRQQPIESHVDPISQIPNRLVHLRSSGFIDLGIIGIMLTPLASVVAILRTFIARGDRNFAGYTLGVLIILSVSITISLLR